MTVTLVGYKADVGGAKSLAYSTNCVGCGCYMRAHLNFRDPANVVVGVCRGNRDGESYCDCTGFQVKADGLRWVGDRDNIPLGRRKKRAKALLPPDAGSQVESAMPLWKEKLLKLIEE